MKSSSRSSGKHRLLLVGVPEACKERQYLYRAVDAGGGGRQARRHTTIQIGVRNVVRHPTITSKSDCHVVSLKTMLKTFMFPLFCTFHLITLCFVPSKAKSLMGCQAGLPGRAPKGRSSRERRAASKGRRDVSGFYPVHLAPLLAVSRERNHPFFFNPECLVGSHPLLHITAPGSAGSIAGGCPFTSTLSLLLCTAWSISGCSSSRMHPI